jgi:Guanosine polyphosphate pyrophosphohydrolases/synthetases
MTSELLEKAIALAKDAHQGQVDKAGAPYISHPLSVMNQCRRLRKKLWQSFTIPLKTRRLRWLTLSAKDSQRLFWKRLTPSANEKEKAKHTTLNA